MKRMIKCSALCMVMSWCLLCVFVIVNAVMDQHGIINKKDIIGIGNDDYTIFEIFLNVWMLDGVFLVLVIVAMLSSLLLLICCLVSLGEKGRT